MNNELRPGTEPPKTFRGHVPHPLYVGLLVALAITVLGLHLCRSQLAGFVAHGEVVVNLKADPTLGNLPETSSVLDTSTERAMQAIRSSETWRQVLITVPELTTELGEMSPAEGETLLNQRLHARQSRMQRDERRIDLEFSSRDRHAALAVIRELSTRFHAALDEATFAERARIGDAYQAVVDAARHDLDQAKGILLSYEKERDTLTARIEADSTAATAEEPEVSRQWQELNRTMGELQQERSRLLVSRTQQHPLIQDIEGQIEELSAKLLETPRLAQPAQAITSEVEDIASQQRRLAGQIARHQAAVQRRSKQLDDILRRQAEADQTQQLLANIQALPIAEPHIVAQLGGRLTPSRFALLLLLATILGLGGGQLAAWARRPQGLRSVEEIEQLLSFPVTGALPFGDQAKVSKLGRPWRPVTLVVARCSEITLLAIGVLILGCLLTRADYSTLLLQDPVAALAEAQQLPLMLLGRG
ncbi:MAG: hypothetical protein WDZ51_15150 [Pirellulaceae bacterium]